MTWPIMGLSTGVNDPDGTKFQVDGGKIGGENARVNPGFRPVWRPNLRPQMRLPPHGSCVRVEEWIQEVMEEISHTIVEES